MDEIDGPVLDPVTRGGLAALLLSLVTGTAAELTEIATDLKGIVASPEAATDDALSALATRYQDLLSGAGEELDSWFVEEDDTRAEELGEEEDEEDWDDDDWDDEGPEPE